MRSRIPSAAVIAGFLIASISVFVAGATWRSSPSPNNLAYDIRASIAAKEIDLRPVDDYLSTMAQTEATRSLVEYSFYSLMYDALHKFNRKSYDSLAINMPLEARQLSIYFIEPDKDKRGILSRYSVGTARSFPSAGIVLVNAGFIKSLISSWRSVEGQAYEKTANGEGAESAKKDSDPPILRLAKPFEEGIPWTPDELSNAQALYIAMYLVIHEVGRVYDYESSGEAAYDSKTDKERDDDADLFFASLFSSLAKVKEFRKDYPTAFAFATSGMRAFVSHDLLERFGLTESEIAAGNEIVYMKDGVFARDPPLSYRLIEVLYNLFKENDKNTQQTFPAEVVYQRLLTNVRLTRSFVPWS